ncbi:aspartate dehydrogenase [Piscinibacter sakaiensis]|uniref:aspartate dehydrogenase n=1 Tax=Piscinibacter sakaiensis TaxID=1547922 RepID=UPI003AAA6712
MLRIAMIGFGAIGTNVLERVRQQPELDLHSVVVSESAQARAAEWLREHGFAHARALTQLDLGGQRPDLVVECAGHRAIGEHVLPALRNGLPCLLASVGALAEDGLVEEIEQAAKQGGTQVQLLSGAVGAIDALAAARVGGLTRVRYSGHKPPAAWSGTSAAAAIDLDALDEATLLFAGSAREAASRFPKNANVAATIALAGLGLDRTEVHLFADPTISGNRHHLEAEGAFGHLELTISGNPLAANPKTSALTVFSIVRALLDRAQPLCF